MRKLLYKMFVLIREVWAVGHRDRLMQRRLEANYGDQWKEPKKERRKPDAKGNKD